MITLRRPEDDRC